VHVSMTPAVSRCWCDPDAAEQSRQRCENCRTLQVANHRYSTQPDSASKCDPIILRHTCSSLLSLASSAAAAAVSAARCAASAAASLACAALLALHASDSCACRAAPSSCRAAASCCACLSWSCRQNTSWSRASSCACSPASSTARLLPLLPSLPAAVPAAAGGGVECVASPTGMLAAPAAAVASSAAARRCALSVAASLLAAAAASEASSCDSTSFKPHTCTAPGRREKRLYPVHAQETSEGTCCCIGDMDRKQSQQIVCLRSTETGSVAVTVTCEVWGKANAQHSMQHTGTASTLPHGQVQSGAHLLCPHHPPAAAAAAAAAVLLGRPA
jgi:hypothetical protein